MSISDTLSIINFFISGIIFYFTFNMNRYFKKVEIVEKSKLNIDVNGTKFDIKNLGSYPLDDISCKFHFYDEEKKYNLGTLMYNVETTLNIDDKITLNFHAHVNDLLEKAKYMRKNIVEMPVGYDSDGEMIFGNESIYHLISNCTILLTLTLNYSMLDESYKIIKKYYLNYLIQDDFF